MRNECKVKSKFGKFMVKIVAQDFDKIQDYKSRSGKL